VKTIHVHLVSDSTGDTVRSVARACLVQFEEVEPVEHFWVLVRSPGQMKRVVEGIAAHPGLVLCTVVDETMRRSLEEACQRMGVPFVAMLDPVMAALGMLLDARSVGEPGRQHALDTDYFNRIEAMNYTMAHDDGQSTWNLNEADVVLVGVSRTSKTPTSIYLANRGLKVANVPVVPGVVATSTADAVDQAKRYRDAGAAGLVVIRQPGLPTSDAGVEDFYVAVADAVDVPLVLYTNPGVTGVDIPLPVIRRLAAHPQIVYLKDASGVTGRILSIITSVGDQLQVFSASAHIPAVVLRIGGVGWMAGPACAIPRASVHLYELCRAGKWDDAFALQEVLWPLNELFQRHGIAACVKAALTVRGYDVGPPLPPQTPLGDAAIADVAAALAAIDAEVAP